jgi:hypothetical protein
MSNPPPTPPPATPPPAKKKPLILTGEPLSEEQIQLEQWFREQKLKSVDHLETAGRELLALTTTLMGLVFGLLALNDDPSYLDYLLNKFLAAGVVMGLFASLILSVTVIYPKQWNTAENLPDEQAQTFKELLTYKSKQLTYSLISFAITMLLAVLFMLFAIFSS